MTGSCPAYSKTCNVCKKMGHFEKCCLKFKKINQITARNDDLFESDSSDGSNLFVGTISQKDLISLDDGWPYQLMEQLVNIKLIVANILPFNEFNNLNNCPKLSKTNTNLIAYNGTNIPVRLMCCQY